MKKTNQFLCLMLLGFYLVSTFSTLAAVEPLQLKACFTNDQVFKPIKIIAIDDNIYLFDNGDQALKVLTHDNKLVRIMGRKGEGPGEFRNVTDFIITGEKIFLLDSFEIDIYNRKDGAYLETKRIMEPIRPIKLWNTDDQGFYLSALDLRPGGKLIHTYLDNKTHQLQATGSFMDCTPVDQTNLAALYKNFGSLALHNDRLYFAYMISNQVIELSPDGKVLNQISAPFQPIDYEEIKIKMQGGQMNLTLDKGVNIELRVHEKDLYLLSIDANGESVIFKLQDSTFNDYWRTKEKIASFDINANEIWAIGTIHDDIHFLVYDLRNPQTQKTNKKTK